MVRESIFVYLVNLISFECFLQSIRILIYFFVVVVYFQFFLILIRIGFLFHLWLHTLSCILSFFLLVELNKGALLIIEMRTVTKTTRAIDIAGEVVGDVGCWCLGRFESSSLISLLKEFARSLCCHYKYY